MIAVTIVTTVSLDGRQIAELIGLNQQSADELPFMFDYFETLLVRSIGKPSDFETLVSKLMLDKHMPMKKFGHAECLLTNLVAPHQARLLHDKNVGIMIDLPRYQTSLKSI